VGFRKTKQFLQMRNIIKLILSSFISICSYGQKTEAVYIDAKDSSAGSYIVVFPPDGMPNSFMILLDGFGNSPQDVMVQSGLPKYAAQKGILTIIPLLKTGALYFGSDDASQQSLKSTIDFVVAKYKLQGKNFYIGGFSIGGTCAIKFAELAVQKNYAVKPKAVFARDPPLDWERFYDAARRVVRLSPPGQVSGEVSYMIKRIETEMGGAPSKAIANYYKQSPYSYSDTTQRAIKNLVNTPVMIITEPDIQWWLAERGYDYSYTNCADHAAMINELRRLGNSKAELVTTINKGYRKPGNKRHPHSWSIVDPVSTVKWLLSQ
jgi:hypothetical protein